MPDLVEAEGVIAGLQRVLDRVQILRERTRNFENLETLEKFKKVRKSLEFQKLHIFRKLVFLWIVDALDVLGSLTILDILKISVQLSKCARHFRDLVSLEILKILKIYENLCFSFEIQGFWILYKIWQFKDTGDGN